MCPARRLVGRKEGDDEGRKEVKLTGLQYPAYGHLELNRVAPDEVEVPHRDVTLPDTHAVAQERIDGSFRLHDTMVYGFSGVRASTRIRRCWRVISGLLGSQC